MTTLRTEIEKNLLEAIFERSVIEDKIRVCEKNQPECTKLYLQFRKLNAQIKGMKEILGAE